MKSRITASALALLMVSLAAAAAWSLEDILPHASLSLLFVVAVLFVAIRAGLIPGLVTAVLGFLTMNFFFTEPRYTLHVNAVGDAATLLMFLLVAAVTGQLAGAMRREADANTESIRKLSILTEFSRKMLGAVDEDQLFSRLAAELRALPLPGWMLIVPDEAAVPRILHANGTTQLSTGQTTELWNHAADRFYWSSGYAIHTLSTDTGRFAVLAVRTPATEPDELIESLCSQAAAAVERIRLAGRLAAARLDTETEQLRSALLSSVSHDLRTPLSSIIGSTSTLRDLSDSLTEDDREALLDTVLDEARRLDRYIQNLLDMTRLGHGRIPLHRDWVDVRDLVESATARVRPSREAISRVEVNIPPDVPMLWVHGALIEQALVNLLDNALRFSSPEGRIRIRVSLASDSVVIEVEDEGVGIPEHLRERVFDMFYTAQQGDRAGKTGTGLGLAICKGLIGAHHGSIVALPGRSGSGTCMRIRLPLTDPGPGTHR